VTRTPCVPSVSAPVESKGWIFLPAVLFAALDWVALIRGWKRVDYISKPAVIVALLLAIGSAGSSSEQSRLFVWSEIALGLSLIGDVLLMLPRERFLPGLIAFLLAYLAYTLAFTHGSPPITWITLLLGAGCVLALATLYRSILTGLNKSGRTHYKIPTFLFGISLTLMTYTGLLTCVRPFWPQSSAIWIGAGALMIFISDSLLALNRFVQPVSRARLKIRIAYHLGQIAIIFGVSQFL
jgi:uncharacterized membrane protein YhhN